MKPPALSASVDRTRIEQNVCRRQTPGTDPDPNLRSARSGQLVKMYQVTFRRAMGEG